MPSLLMSVKLSKFFKVSILKFDLHAFGDAGKNVLCAVVYSLLQ